MSEQVIAISEALGILITIGSIIYGAGKIAGGFNNLAASIREMKEDIKVLLHSNNDHEVRLEVHGQQLDNHEHRLVKLES